MKKLQQGLTLIETMLVLGVIGILIAVGIPVWQDHANKKKVTEDRQIEKSIAAPPLD